LTPISVLHILNSTSGGSALSTFELIEELGKYNITSSLVCYKNGSESLRKEISIKVEGRVLFIPLYWMNKKIRAKRWKRPFIESISIWQTWFGYRYQKELKRFAIKHQIDIVHTSTILNPEGAILSRNLSIPHVWHCRELIGTNNPFQFYFLKRWSKWVDKHADEIIANSALTYNELLKYFRGDKISLINNGIRVSDFTVKLHEDKKPIIVGMIGNITSRLKNHQLFIDVASLTYELNNNVEFHIFGMLPDDNDAYLSDLKGRIIERPYIKLRGFIATESALMEMDIMFHPAYKESFGRVIIEAMAVGIPVVGLTDGGQKNIILDAETGFLVDKDNKQEIANRINNLIESYSLRSIFGTKATNQAIKKFDLTQVTKHVISQYNHALSTS